MRMLKRARMIVLATLLITSLSVPCSAADTAFKEVLDNAFYGGLVGVLVGGSLLAFTHKPADHLDYLSIGAASGVLAGVGYTLAKQSKSLVSIENGNVKFAMPAIIPEFQQAGVKGVSSVMLKAELVSGKF